MWTKLRETTGVCCEKAHTMLCLPHSVITQKRGGQRGTTHSFQCLLHDSRFAPVLGSSLRRVLPGEGVRERQWERVLFRSLFPVMNIMRFPGYLQYKWRALKKALKERSFTCGSLSCSAVRKKGLAMRKGCERQWERLFCILGEFEASSPILHQQNEQRKGLTECRHTLVWLEK